MTVASNCVKWRFAAMARGSYIRVACRSVCDRDQSGIKRSTFFFGADQGIKTNSEQQSTHFLTYYGGVATFCPLNSRKIKRSRASERSDQAIKDDFHRSRFLIAVANASTGDAYVTTPCMVSLEEVGPGWPRHTSRNNYRFCHVTSELLLKVIEYLYSMSERSRGSPLPKTPEVESQRHTIWLFFG